MRVLKVNIGSSYKVVKSTLSLEKGTLWFAWYYGELVLLELKQDGVNFSGRQKPYDPTTLKKAIEKGYVVEVKKHVK